MGIDTTVWRARIGTFVIKARSSFIAHPHLNMPFSINLRIMSTLTILCLLAISGIEKNPGPGPQGPITRSSSSRHESHDSHPDNFTNDNQNQPLIVELPPTATDTSLSTVPSSSVTTINTNTSSPTSLDQPTLSDLLSEIKQLRSTWTNDLNSLSMKIDSSLSAFRTIADDLKSRLSTCDNQITDIKNDSIDICTRIKRLEDQMRFVDNNARSHNVVVYGIAECDHESSEQCICKVKDFLYDFFDMSDSACCISQVIRVGKFLRNTSTRPVVAKFTDVNVRNLILRNAFKLRGTSFSISEDVDSVVRNKRKILYDHFKQEGFQSKDIVLRYDQAIVQHHTYHVNNHSIVEQIR